MLSAAAGVLEEVVGEGLEVAEVFAKRGRSRRFEVDAAGEAISSSEEAGWAVRAGDAVASFFRASCGTAPPRGPWGRVAAGGLRLPPPSPETTSEEMPSEEPGILPESSGLAALGVVAETLAREEPAAPPCRAILEDGSSEVRLINSLGIDVAYRSRAAYLRAELPTGRALWSQAVLVGAAAGIGDLDPADLARRLARTVRVLDEGRPLQPVATDVVVAPEVGAGLLAALGARLAGASQAALVAFWGGQPEQVAGPGVNLIDDGRYPGGALSSPYDGEGVATARRVLVEEGRLAGTLEPWDRSTPALGCRRRAGWRDLPRVALSHLFIEPRADVRAEDVLADLDRGYHLIATRGDLERRGRQLSLGVCGFEVARGRPLGPVVGRLVWDPAKILAGVRAVANDLRFLPLGAMFGTPTMRIAGMELVGEA